MDTIKQLINGNKTDEAILLLKEYIEKHPESDEAYYLLGNAYLKQGEIRLALNNYLTAMDINPESPAKTAYDAQIRILNFYNKDMFNH